MWFGAQLQGRGGAVGGGGGDGGGGGQCAHPSAALLYEVVFTGGGEGGIDAVARVWNSIVICSTDFRVFYLIDFFLCLKYCASWHFCNSW